MTVKKISTTQKVDWSVPKAGMRLIKPTSIANSGGSASIGTNGVVTFTGVTTISLNEVFTADFDNYQVSIACTSVSGGSNVNARLRSAGTDVATNYTNQGLGADGGSVGAGRQGPNAAFFQSWSNTYATQRSGSTVYVYGPALAQPTACRVVSASDYLSAYIADNASTHSLSTAYDGFSLFVTGAGVTITGKVSVYGVAK